MVEKKIKRQKAKIKRQKCALSQAPLLRFCFLPFAFCLLIFFL